MAMKQVRSCHHSSSPSSLASAKPTNSTSILKSPTAENVQSAQLAPVGFSAVDVVEKVSNVMDKFGTNSFRVIIITFYDHFRICTSGFVFCRV